MDKTGFTSLKLNRIRKLVDDDAAEGHAIFKLIAITSEIISRRGYEVTYSNKLYGADREYICIFNYHIDNFVIEDEIDNIDRLSCSDICDLNEYVNVEVDTIPDIIPLSNYDHLGHEIVILELLARTLIYPHINEEQNLVMNYDVEFSFKFVVQNRRDSIKNPSSR
jgi:hypothetical protein